MKNIAANWKTTLAGAITGGTISIDALIETGLTKGWKQALVGLAIMLIGFFAKDGDTTGVGATATKVESALLPAVDALTANSTNVTVEDIHKIIDKLVPLIPVPPPAAPIAPIAAPAAIG